MDSTQLLYLRSRYYNPTDGRFQSRDTWGGDVNRPLSLNLWGYVEGNPVNYIDPTGKIKENESTDAHSIVNDLKLYNVTIRVDWGYSYRDIKGTPCGWRKGEWIMKDLKAIQAAVHIMSDGVSFIGGSLKSLIGNVQILPKKTESGASGAVPGEIRWRVQNANSEKYRLYVAIHETGHIISYHDSRMVDYFMTELGAHCSNQPAGSIGYYCNENTQTGVDYDPGPYAGDSNDPIKYMPSLYATKGSYEDFAETWRETAIKAYIDSGNSLYSKEANLVYSHEVYSHDIGERRVVMTSIIDGTWK